MVPADLPALLAQGERAAVALALNLVEDQRAAARAAAISLLRDTTERPEHRRIGVTGPPGAGKSTLLARMIAGLRAQDRSVGVLAVDPSSPRSGGALLGDRVRLDVDPTDAGVFVRSLASGGLTGGLARAVLPGVQVLARAFDVVLVETTGVGQGETDIELVADTVVLVVQPGSGDVLQFLKAGIMEVPDLLVVNKLDHGETAQRAVRDLTAALGQLHGAGVGTGPWQPRVLSTSARDGTGITELLAALEAHRESLVARDELTTRRRRGALGWALRAYLRRHGEVGVEQAGGLAVVESTLARMLDQGRNVLEV